MKSYLVAYIASLITFLAIDAIWLGFIAKKLYAAQLGHLMRPDVLWAPAALFYLFYVVAIVVLAVRPGDMTQSLSAVFMLGMLVGLVGYGTYNATNLATLNGWPPMMSLVDFIWGAVLSGVVALSGALANRYFS